MNVKSLDLHAAFQAALSNLLASGHHLLSYRPCSLVSPNYHQFNDEVGLNNGQGKPPSRGILNKNLDTMQSQLRLASQRLGQVQAKHDSQANITYTDIATLIQRGNVSLAREKAEKLVMDEAYGDLLEELELQIGVVQEHFHELERRYARDLLTNCAADRETAL